MSSKKTQQITKLVVVYLNLSKVFSRIHKEVCTGGKAGVYMCKYIYIIAIKLKVIHLYRTGWLLPSIRRQWAGSKLSSLYDILIYSLSLSSATTRMLEPVFIHKDFTTELWPVKGDINSLWPLFHWQTNIKCLSVNKHEHLISAVPLYTEILTNISFLRRGQVQ